MTTMKRTPEEREHEEQVQAFLNQCVVEKRIDKSTGKPFTKRQSAEISLTRGGMCSQRPDHLVTYNDLIRDYAADTGLPESVVQECIEAHLRSAQLTPRHLELYANYPAWTEEELGKMYNLPRRTVGRNISAVRRAWPNGLRFDTDKTWGVPSSTHMKRIETSANSDDRLDGREVIKL